MFLGCNDTDEIDYINNSSIENILVYKSNTEYCAFCDMVYYEGKYYIAFRMGNNHVPLNGNDRNGYIAIMSSVDSKTWSHEFNIVDEEWDLRDPNFCVNTKTNELYLNYGLYHFDNKNPRKKNKLTRLKLNNNILTVDYTEYIDVEKYSHFWLWKIYWHDNKYWSVAYYTNQNPILVTSEDGIHYKYISTLPINANETALCFDNERITAVSRNADDYGNAFVSSCTAPYTNWNVSTVSEMIASPEIVKDKYDRIYIGGRSRYGVSVFTFDISYTDVKPFYNLFSIGSYSDRGYPGMICKYGRLYICYYSCNDFTKVPSIYLTIITL